MRPRMRTIAVIGMLCFGVALAADNHGEEEDEGQFDVEALRADESHGRQVEDTANAGSDRGDGIA